MIADRPSASGGLPTSAIDIPSTAQPPTEARYKTFIFNNFTDGVLRE